MSDMKYVTYCGLYCKLCAQLARIPQQASTLRDTMKEGGWEFFGEQCLPGFKNFWEYLAKVIQAGEQNSGCRGGCGNPDCKVRICAREKDIELCSACEEFPCEKMQWLVDLYPNLVADGKRQQAVGLEQWIQEQDARCETGFCYSQICHPCDEC
ncbi:MAG: DUF3795 domain-containing protein [Phycisphaerae bacterium]|nr:DUF3795 domain-containing protein [Phycisphaerae bacterium]